jgi:hypothetical protein
MDKLTGGRDVSPIPPPMAQDDMTIKPSSAGRLQRSGTVGARMFQTPTKAPAMPVDEPPAAAEPVRPRLQRSFTVSSTNMGEERRSAVGRRMVERLAARKAARDEEGAEVRRMWEERRAEAAQIEEEDSASESEPESNLPVLQRHSPAEPPVEQFNPSVTFGGAQTLGIPERPISRETMQSNGGPFEYESHLRRSLSSRTARNAVGVVSDTEPDRLPTPQANDVESLERYYHPSPIIPQDVHDLAPPRPAFATPSRHVAQDSTSTDGTIQGDKSPGSDTSRDGLNSMMFVMGSGSQGGRGNPRQENSWPTEVGDQGSSDWGTPQRSLDWTSPKVDPEAHRIGSSTTLDHTSPKAREYPARSTLSSAVVSEAESSSPSHQAMRESGMSWTEVGGPADLEVPSDVKYHKKSGSVSAKFGRTIQTAMRKRSQSRSSQDSTRSHVVGEVINQVKQTFSRRGSASSASPRVNSTAQMSHQPSMSSLSPSLARSDSISNSALLQHEGPNREWMPPRADPDDPRIVSSKMSPFPGIAALEDKSRLLEPQIAPRLLHQASDSVVPTQQRTQVPEAIYALPLPTPTKDNSVKRGSAESAKKQGWLAKTFSTPRSSGSLSRKSSVVESSPIPEDGNFPPPIAADPFAPLPLPAPIAMRRTGSRTGRASPAVSVVPEGSEDGSRMTRYATPVNRLEQSSTPIIEDSGLTEKSADVLHRMETMLALGIDDPARPEILDDPPRKLLLSTQVLQVVNVHVSYFFCLGYADGQTAKDRYLFLYTDLLVIAKPLITHGHQATLDMQYIVKSIVPLDQLHISGFETESTTESDRHPIVEQFINQFAVDPVMACRFLAETSNVQVDSSILASLLFKTPELDKTQVGNLLSGNDKLVRTFVDRFNFGGIRIDIALRMFLLSLRMPSDPNASEPLLLAFAQQYHQANGDLVDFDTRLASALVLAIVQLNDALYGTFGFALPNHAITQDVFISAFRSRDQDRFVPDRLLADIYSSIRTNSLVQALATHERGMARQVVVSPARLAPKLTYDTWSERIYVSIPSPDPSFKIRLHGQGLVFDPPILDFSGSSEESFRVKGTSLGNKILLFDRLGANAYVYFPSACIHELIDSARYASLGNSRAFTIERAFMRHTFQISFMSPTNLKRKYCFSVPSDEMKSKWGQTLQKQIAICKSKSQASVTKSNELRQVAEKVSQQVLRDAVIPQDSSQPNESRARRGSVSTTYDQLAGTNEKALGPLQLSKSNTISDRTSGMVDIRTGKELVLLCRQNSLLPGLLELLSAGREDIKPKQVIPVQSRPNGSAFRQQQSHRPGLSQGQSQSYTHGQGHGRIPNDGKRGIITGRF